MSWPRTSTISCPAWGRFTSMASRASRFGRRLQGDVDVAVDVFEDAVVPHEAWAFEATEGPVVGAGGLEEAEVDLLHAAVAAHQVHDLVAVLAAIRRDQVAHDGLDKPA